MKIKEAPPIVAEARELLLDKFSNIIFDEGPHTYTVDGELYMPVSTVISQFEEPFDKEGKSKSCALKQGVTQEEILRKWKYTNLKSTISGTRTHLYGESYTWLMCGLNEKIPQESLPQLVEDENWLMPTYGKEEAIKKFYDELHESLYPVGAEFKMSSQYMGCELKMCGTADLLFYYWDKEHEDRSGFVIGDWKTNASLTNNYVRSFNMTMKEPFDNYLDEALSHYYVQLNLYQRMMESVGLNVIGRRIVWLKDNGNYEIFKVPYIEEEKINQVLNPSQFKKDE